MIVIGSIALQHHYRDIGRIPADIDLMMSAEEFIEFTNEEVPPSFRWADKERRIEIWICSPHSPYQSDWLVYQYSTHMIQDASEYIIPGDTRYFKATFASKPILKVLKESSAKQMDKAKHYLDMKLLEDVELDESLKRLSLLRSKETDIRVAVQKDLFFNRFNIPRIFEHDHLHTLIAEIPAYKAVLADSVNINIPKFMAQSPAYRRLVIWEESLVLAMERWLLPKLRACPAAQDALMDNFMKIEKSSDPIMTWLDKLSIPSRVLDHPSEIANWALENREFMMQGFKEWVTERVGSIPQSFWKSVMYGASIVLFVGQNPTSKNIDQPFVGTKSGVTLDSWIKTSVPFWFEVKITNAYSKPTPRNRGLLLSEMLAERERLVAETTGTHLVITLGKTAARAAQGLGHFNMPHPSGLNRVLNDKDFINKKLQELRQRLEA